MSEDEMRLTLERCDRNDAEQYMESCFDLTGDARALVAEVRRLRALVKDAETQHLTEDYDAFYGCPWCRAKTTWHNPRDPEVTKLADGGLSIPLKPQAHAPDCPAFTESGEVR